MSRLKSRIAALERRTAPGDLVYAVAFDPAGLSRDGIIAEEARRRHAKGDFRPFALAPDYALAPDFAVVPEVAETTEAWLAAAVAAGLR